MSERKLTAIKAIRLFCIACMGGSFAEVKDCATETCMLNPFRLGRNPNISEATRAKSRARAQENQLGKKVFHAQAAIQNK